MVFYLTYNYVATKMNIIIYLTILKNITLYVIKIMSKLQRILLLSLSFFVFENNCFAQQVQYERNAIFYFFDSVFSLNYPKAKSVDFSGNVEKEKSHFFRFDECFNDFHAKNDSLAVNSKTDIKEMNFKDLKINGYKWKKYTSYSKRRLKMFVYQANLWESKVYVLIMIIKVYSYNDAYMFELNTEGKVLRWCKTGQYW